MQSVSIHRRIIACRMHIDSMKAHTAHAVRVIAVVLIAVTATGCEETKEQFATASGTVTVDGKPLSGAVITLEPLPGTPGGNTSATVLSGRFQIDESDQLRGGTYLARISMLPLEIRKKFPPEQIRQLPPPAAVVAPEFDADSRMRCELKPGQDNTLAFEIEFLSTR